MRRKSICPVCNKTFEVFLRNQACCCKEHQAEWRKMQRAARDQRRIVPDDLDWANAMLEKARSQIAALMALLAIRKEVVEQERVEKAENTLNEQKADEKTQKPALESQKPQKNVESVQKSALAVEKIKRTSPEFAPKPQIKGKGKFLKECENCLQDFRTTDNRDRFCCDACKQEYAREMGV